MVFFKQLLAIMSVSLMAELLSIYLRAYLYIPAPIVGIILLLVLLKLGLFKDNYVNTLAPNFVYHISLVLIPSAVGIMSYLSLIKRNMIFFSISVVVISTISTVVTVLLSNFVLRFVRGKR